MTGDEFIELAGQLAANPKSSEAAFRTAVSRAYYGAMHLAESFLTELGFPVPANKSPHDYLKTQFQESGHRVAFLVGGLLRDLHEERKQADYKLSNRSAGTAEFAKTCVETAHELRALLHKCEQPENRENIRDGIRTYRNRVAR